MVVFVDTQILIWGVRGYADPGQETKVFDAKVYLEQLQSKGVEIAIAAPTIAEYLIKTPDEDREKVLEVFRRHFVVYPFDTASAAIGAEMWKKYFGDSPQGKVAASFGMTRQILKVDYQIVSIAVARGADFICTEDERMSKFASRFIKTKKLPESHKQMDLFSGELEAAPATDEG